MKLIYRERILSWFDSSDIYDENGNTVYTIKGRLHWGHKFEIFDRNENSVAEIVQEILTLMPRFAIYKDGEYIGCVSKNFTLFSHSFSVDFKDWSIDGDVLAWDFTARDGDGETVFTASKQFFEFTDKYVLDIPDEKNALYAVLVMTAIDAAMCRD